MGSIIIFYILVTLSVIGVLSFFVCNLKITLEKIRKSRFTRNLSIFLFIYFFLSVAWLKFFDYIPKTNFKDIISYVLSLGVVIAPVILVIGIPGSIIRFERDKKVLKPFLIGLLSILTSITIWIILHKLGYEPF